MTDNEKRQEALEQYLNDLLKNEGMGTLASLFTELYDGYRELAEHVTHGDYKQDWSHEDVKKYIPEF
jgi:hypothetical protein